MGLWGRAGTVAGDTLLLNEPTGTTEGMERLLFRWISHEEVSGPALRKRSTELVGDYKRFVSTGKLLERGKSSRLRLPACVQYMARLQNIAQEIWQGLQAIPSFLAPV